MTDISAPAQTRDFTRVGFVVLVCFITVLVASVSAGGQSLGSRGRHSAARADRRRPRRRPCEAEPGARPSEGAMSPGATSRCSRPLPTGALRRGLAARGLLVSLSFLKTKINSVFKHVHQF